MGKALIEFSLLVPADLTKLIGSVGMAYQAADKKSQAAAVHAAGYAIKFGDHRFMNDVLNALSKSNRKASFVAWAEFHCPVAYSEKDKRFAHFQQEGKVYDFDGNKLIGNLWFEFKPEVVVSTLDAQDAVTKMIKRIEASIKRDPQGTKHAAILDFLNIAVMEYNKLLVGEIIEGDAADEESKLHAAEMAESTLPALKAA